MVTREKPDDLEAKAARMREYIDKSIAKDPDLKHDPAVREIIEDLEFALQHLENDDDMGANSCLSDAEKLAEEIGLDLGD